MKKVAKIEIVLHDPYSNALCTGGGVKFLPAVEIFPETMQFENTNEAKFSILFEICFPFIYYWLSFMYLSNFLAFTAMV